MIRDLRSLGTEPRRGLSMPVMPTSDALAYARHQIARSDEITPPTRTSRAYTIAVTAPRLLECKRGFAAHLAAHLAAVDREASPVCLVDLDTESRDVGRRLQIAGPALLDLAKSTSLSRPDEVARMVTRMNEPPLSVVPTRLPEPALAQLLRRKTPHVLSALANAYDVMVIDAPVALGVTAPDVDRPILEHVDVVLVAVTLDASALGGALRYLNALAAAVDNPTFETYLVLTGSDHDKSRTLHDGDDLERELEDLPILGRVPQMWGRQRPDGVFDPNADARVNAAFADLIDVLVGAL
jgi:Mrp family chromosome partitioning ATPase